MDKQSFYDNQLVTNADLNTAFDNAGAADELLTQQCVGFGISYGMWVAAVAGQLQINVSQGYVFDKSGKACQFTAPSGSIQSVVNDTAGNPIAVGAGQERWVSVFAKIGCDLKGHAVNSSGGAVDTTNYTQQPTIVSPYDRVVSGGQEAFPHGDAVVGTEALWVVAGVPAAVGSAARPSLQSTAVLVCDLYVANGQADFSGNGVIDYQRREVFQRTEQPMAGLLPPSGTSGFFLWQTFGRGAFTTRIYVAARSGGLFITTNASLVPAPGVHAEPMWNADSSAVDSRGYSLGAFFGISGTEQIQAVVKTAGTNVANWTTGYWVTVGHLA